MKRSARDAYDRLYQYFGLRSRDEYLNSAAGQPVAKTESSGNTNKSELGAISEVYHALFGDEEHGFSIEEICQLISQIKLEDSKKIFCVTPYRINDTAIMSFGSEENKVPLNGWDRLGYKDQGIPGSKTKNVSTYSIQKIDEEKFKNDENRIDVIQVFPASAVAELADTDILTLYLSTINSVNMSQAVPYVDVTVSTYGERGTTQPFSFGGFLGSKDRLLSSDFVDSTKIKSSANADKKYAEKIVASMEIFTSPQTLVNAENVRYDENSPAGLGIDKFRPFMAIESLNLNVVSANAGLIAFKTANMKLKLFDRGRLSDIAPIVAPSRFGVVKFDIEYGWSHPGGGTKTALRQGSIDNTGRLADANDDRIGQLIDAMRVKETYQVVNSNFTFEQDGSVSIDLKLSMLGSSGMLNKTVSFSSDEADFAEIDSILKEVKRLLSNAPKNINIPATLTGDSDTFLRMSKNEKENFKKFVNNLRASNKDGNLRQAGKIAASLLNTSAQSPGSVIERFQSTRKDAARNFVRNLRQKDDPFLRTEGISVSGVSQQELKDRGYASLGSILVSALGPMFQDFGEVIFVFGCFNKDAGAMYDHNVAQFPIKLEGKGNKSKGDVTLQSALEKLLQQNSRITPELFLEMLNDNFLLRVGTEAYGLNQVFNRPEQTDSNEQIKDIIADKIRKKVEKSDNQLILEEKKTAVLEEIYGEGKRSSPSFTVPRVSIKIDTKTTKNGKQIIKVIVTDQAASNVADIQQIFDDIMSDGFAEKDDFSGSKSQEAENVRSANHGERANQVYIALQKAELIEQAPTLDQLQKNDKTAVFPKGFEKRLERMFVKKSIDASNKKIKEIFYRFFPVLVYGSMGSGIITAQLSSNQNDALTTINLQKQPEQIPGLPLLIHPTQLSMEVFGTPLFKYSQKFFVDFGTGTSADNFYVVTGVDMNFSPGEFKCNLKMTHLDSYGKFMKLKDTIITTMIATYRYDNKKMMNKQK